MTPQGNFASIGVACLLVASLGALYVFTAESPSSRDRLRDKSAFQCKALCFRADCNRRERERDASDAITELGRRARQPRDRNGLLKREASFVHGFGGH